MKQHRSTVTALSKQVATFYRSQIPFRIYHGNTNSTRPSTRTSTNTLDVSSLNSILSVSPSTKTCLCEPNVSMEDLLTATLKHGLMPPVVPEFRKITVGGAFSGTAGESSCFKYGFFDRSVTWIEMILADGEVITASENERKDLFRGAAGTFGTLGVTTLFEIRLIDAKPYVELTYLPVSSIQQAVDLFEDAMTKDLSGEQPIDFLDGIMFSPTHGSIMTGRMISSPFQSSQSPSKELVSPRPSRIRTFHKATDEWFSLHAQSQSSTFAPHTDFIPLPSYIFRYDRGAFWVGRYAYTYFLTPFNRLTRFLLDPLMHTAIMYHALHRSGVTSNFIIQDMAVPAYHMAEFSKWLDSDSNDPSDGGGKCAAIYPRWLCPLKAGEPISMNPHISPTNTPTSSRSSSPSPPDAETTAADYLLNIGIWGPLPSRSPSAQLRINRAIEAKLSALSGMKWLYAQTFYTEDEFWRIYNKKSYDRLRRKYKAEGLPDVYAKVGPRPEALRVRKRSEMGWREWVWETVWPLKGVYGLLSAVKGGDYLRKRK